MSGYEIRRYKAADEPAVLELMGHALGWRPSDPNADLFRWKHRDNPFGRSPAWVAVEDTALIGFRTFMRWQFKYQDDIVMAVRAVDTATHPAHQGRGIFKALTLHAIEELRADGTSFIFNTPNDRSLPGYLKMGWQVAGRARLVVRPRNARAVVRMLASRVPADLWSCPTRAGTDALTAVPALAAHEHESAGSPEFATHRDTSFLRWRYGFEKLHYRSLTIDGGPNPGTVIFRVRRRGRARELAICAVSLASGPGPAHVHRLLRDTRADYAVAIGATTGLLPLPGQGPLITYRPLIAGLDLDLSTLHLELGDVELF